MMGLLLTLWGLCRILLWEDHDQFEKTTLPHGPFLTGDAALPLFDVEDARGVSLGLCEEPEWVISAPELSTHMLVKRATCCPRGRLYVPLFVETILTERHSHNWAYGKLFRKFGIRQGMRGVR